MDLSQAGLVNIVILSGWNTSTGPHTPVSKSCTPSATSSSPRTLQHLTGRYTQLPFSAGKSPAETEKTRSHPRQRTRDCWGDSPSPKPSYPHQAYTRSRAQRSSTPGSCPPGRDTRRRTPPDSWSVHTGDRGCCPAAGRQVWPSISVERLWYFGLPLFDPTGPALM